MSADVTSGRTRIDWRELAETAEPDLVRNAIARETQSWGTALVGLGILQLTRSGDLDPVWGVALIVTGVASFAFRSAAMLPVYGVLLVWATINNLSSGSWLWVAVGALQAYLAFRTFRQFAILRRAAVRLNTGFGAELPPRPDRAAGVFPWTGCAFSGLAFIGVVALIVAGVWYAVAERELSEQTLGTALVALADLSCLGMGFAVAALLAGYGFRVISILAVFGSALLLACLIALAIFGGAS